MVYEPEGTVPMPLQITLGVSPWILSLGTEAVAFEADAEREKAYTAAIAGALRQDVGVFPFGPAHSRERCATRLGGISQPGATC